MKILSIAFLTLLISVNSFAGEFDLELEKKLITIKEEVYHQEHDSTSLDISIIKRQKALDSLLLKRQILAEETALQHVIRSLEDRLAHNEYSADEEDRILDAMITLLEVSAEEGEDAVDRFFNDHKDNRE
ncbi:hypothetical protein M902_1893 [Bacteriovorax sp. BAL6_X]|uniref:hypothetical protein n=1 Tax=Bacteriovorax sp. BAL6_X TaxID=1201290 RepID=UPI0003866D48|nr:hypothetical protein [Bacteriovorax sp. BAL6_X]EPZ52043.1 hypothetical protein M902_1893 [Bacteriovorax sp. BAL6_X]